MKETQYTTLKIKSVTRDRIKIAAALVQETYDEWIIRTANKEIEKQILKRPTK